MRKVINYSYFIGLLLFCNSIFGQIPPLFYDLSTGTGTIGALDPNWQINSQAGYITAGGQWYTNDPCGQWITNTVGGGLVNSPGGNYTFSIAFEVSNVVFQCDHEAFLNLTFMGADDNISSMTFNGTSLTSSLPSSTSFNNPGSMNVPITVNGGLNTLSMTVYNVNSTPLALQICGGIDIIFDDLIEADQPTLSSTESCMLGSSTLNVASGSLNDADTWNWYIGGCNGTLIGTGDSINVSPTVPTTYFVSGVGTCVNDGPCDSITLDSQSKGWHQYTKSLLGAGFEDTVINEDNIIDVITDLDGNVFVTGSFFDRTVLNGGFSAADLTLQNGQNTYSSSSFIAKYDACGELQWAAQSSTAPNQSNFETDKPTHIALDEGHNLVYIVGYQSGGLVFNSSNICGAGGSMSLPGHSIKPSFSYAYVAAFDMGSGCIQFLEDPMEAAPMKGTAIAVNETNGDLYVATKHTFGNQSTTSTVKKFPFAGGTTLGAYSDLIHIFHGFVAVPGGYNPVSPKAVDVSDMDFNETTGMLYFVGTVVNPDALEYTHKHVPTGPVSNTYVGTPIIQMSAPYPGSNPPSIPYIVSEAYVMAFRDVGNPAIPLSFENMKRGGSVLHMIGRAISTDNSTGEVYIVGTYHMEDWQTLFIPSFAYPQLNQPSTNTLPNNATPGSTPWSAYVVKLDWQLENGWATYATPVSGSGVVDATGVDSRNGRVYVTGTYTDEDMAFDPAVGLPNLPYQLGTGSAGGNNPLLSSRAFVASFNSSGLGLWANATSITNSNTQNGHHYANAIATDGFGNAFMVGMYKENLDYLYTAIPKPPLNSNYVNPLGVSQPYLPKNGFIIRVQDNNLVPNGSLSRRKAPQIESSNEGIALDGVLLYPNPSSGLLNIKVHAKGEYEIVIYELSGKEIFRESRNFESTLVGELKLGSLSGGTYIVQCIGNESIKTERLVVVKQ